MPRVLSALTVACPGRAVGWRSGSKPDPQRPTPTFRTGAHYVRVDAYPTRDGKPILGLTQNDFELLEDGKVQAIDTLEFIDHPEFTPLMKRRDPNSQRDASRRATRRLFVLYLDAFHVNTSADRRTRVPITELLNRMMGPQDLRTADAHSDAERLDPRPADAGDSSSCRGNFRSGDCRDGSRRSPTSSSSRPRFQTKPSS